MVQSNEHITAAQEQPSGKLKRRGLIAGAAALAAAALARQATAPQDVAANDGNFLQLGHHFDTNNTATSETGLYYNGIAPPDGAILIVSDSSAPSLGYPAVIGGHAVNGSVLNGVTGRTFRPNGHGVVGEADGGTNAASSGVYGFSDSGTGVYGTSQGLYGVYGASSQPGGVGVGGTVTGGYGVLGTVSDGYAVLGQATTGNGLYGFSQQNHAVVGQTARPYFGGVFGIATIANTVGIYGSTKSGGSNVASAYAGYFDGNMVVVNGVKSAAVPHADGTHRLVYCLESPESWLEDFGEAKLVNGRAEVKLDPDFAAVVETTGYHVYLTEYGDHNNLFVETRSATGFTVQAKNATGTVQANGVKAGSGTFGYRVVAKRKDIVAERLAKFDLVGKETHDTRPPHLPEPPEIVDAHRPPAPSKP